MKTLRWLLSGQLKGSKQTNKSGGFTLIELLVGLLLAFLVLVPLLGFMIDILSTDRKEQAKSTSEQEVQASLDYIARDLEQAIYIYDADGITAIKSQLPNNGDTSKVPVLVFWKRELLKNALPVASPVASGSTADDTFVYSLVAYYLTNDNTTNDPNQIWSKASRIDRFEIRDGVRDTSTTSVSCTDYPNDRFANGYCPDAGFKQFAVDGTTGSLKNKMDQWQKAPSLYTNTLLTLVDFIDQTTNPSFPSNLSQANFCTTTVSANAQLIVGSAGFYACVDSGSVANGSSAVNSGNRSLAQVYIRGNAMTRIALNTPNYNDALATYFPTANVRVQGRSFIFTK